ncbi:MAG TPA: nitroreductase family deazaflavin-dependent oxidoreductase [Acidimicrobiia bacterium]|jgi:deazaflavin-dependent oxidoreductase (nitroreductase family)|nr:nitroreductase family deazaflavin-dependent oxidoreductase [Acidimicrobiia bacterium]
MGWILWLGGGLVGLVVAVLSFQVLSMRTGWEPGVKAIRKFTRLMNPRQMRTAGQPGAYAAVVRHVGRRTGTLYETPVGVVETDEGLFVALPYGTSPDWFKNVMAEGGAELVYEGETFRVDDPEVVPSAAIDTHTSGVDRFLQRLYGVDQALRLRRVASTADNPASG